MHADGDGAACESSHHELSDLLRLSCADLLPRAALPPPPLHSSGSILDGPRTRLAAPLLCRLAAPLLCRPGRPRHLHPRLLLHPGRLHLPGALAAGRAASPHGAPPACCTLGRLLPRAWGCTASQLWAYCRQMWLVLAYGWSTCGRPHTTHGPSPPCLLPVSLCATLPQQRCMYSIKAAFRDMQQDLAPLSRSECHLSGGAGSPCWECVVDGKRAAQQPSNVRAVAVQAMW